MEKFEMVHLEIARLERSVANRQKAVLARITAFADPASLELVQAAPGFADQIRSHQRSLAFDLERIDAEVNQMKALKEAVAYLEKEDAA